MSRLRTSVLSLVTFVIGGMTSSAEAAALPPGSPEIPRVAATHWAFQPLPAADSGSIATPGPRPVSLDSFVAHRLRQAGLELGREADRSTLIRRVAFILTGLPPRPDDIEQFIHDRHPDAYARLVERYLASPHHGERWGKHWLDAAGYADSNGYFNADTDRPLAYRYRDYVIRSINRDTPFDRFVREQLAGDELASWNPGEPVTPEIIELLVATHFVRNGQDGSGESDGNPDEVRTDRYYALESAMQIIGSSLLGLTVQCAKCHDHKFEPLTQRDYYAFQAFLYPAFNIEKWTKPNDRTVEAALPGELEAWQVLEKQLDAEQTALRAEFTAWSVSHRPAGRVLFSDRFDAAGSLGTNWSNTAPGDDASGGIPAVRVGSETAPGAFSTNGALRIIEGGGSGDRWLCTQASFEWQPREVGQWIQVTFDLLSMRLNDQANPSERTGYFIAAHDFNDNSPTTDGNVLIDGHPSGPSAVQVDYPGMDAQVRGNIGTTGYQPGRNCGVRIVRADTNELTLEHLLDGVVDGVALKLKLADLPSGAFGFEYCCGRSFIVDNVMVEASNDGVPGWTAANAEFQKELNARKQKLDASVKVIAKRRLPKPGRIAWTTDGRREAPEVFLLKRGNHKTPGEAVPPAFPSFLRARGNQVPVTAAPTATTTGRRLAWANWITEPGSPQAALLARVTVNRVWQQYFGVGLVATPDNFGLSGHPPTHPELLNWLAGKLVESGWSLKVLHRLMLDSATFRQVSEVRRPAFARDPANELLSRYPIRRFDADAIRDAMLAVSDRLSSKTAGPYVPTPRTGTGEVVVDEAQPEAFARSVFLQQRRTQVPTFLGNFDAPSIVFNCTRRAETTMPLQSLSLLNSDFALQRGADFASRLARECGADVDARFRRAFLLALGRPPDAVEREVAGQFLAAQQLAYAGKPDADHRVWSDFCQTLFGLNSFLYLE